MKRVNKLYAALVLMLAPAITWATIITFGTPTGATSGGQPISATAEFITGAGSLTVILTNTEPTGSIRSSSQAISDVIFILSNPPGAQGALTPVGQFGNVSGTGVVTYSAFDNNVPANTTPGRWFGVNGGTFSIVGNQITMEALGGGQPSEMILPFIANGGQYTNANNGVQNFNSYVIGPGTFTLALAGVTDQTTVTAVQLSFGTGGAPGDTIVPGHPLPEGAPEPATLALLGLGLAALGFSRKRAV